MLHNLLAANQKTLHAISFAYSLDSSFGDFPSHVIDVHEVITKYSNQSETGMRLHKFLAANHKTLHAFSFAYSLDIDSSRYCHKVAAQFHATNQKQACCYIGTNLNIATNQRQA